MIKKKLESLKLFLASWGNDYKIYIWKWDCICTTEIRQTCEYPCASGSVIHCAIAVEEKGKRKQAHRLVSSLDREPLQMLCGNSLAFSFQNRTMDVSLLGITCTSFVFNKNVLEKIKQNEMNPSWNWPHSITVIQTYRTLHSGWLRLVRNLFEKGSTLNYRGINKKGMIPGCVCSSDITIDAF